MTNILSKEAFAPAKAENEWQFECDISIDQIIIIEGKRQTEVDAKYEGGTLSVKYQSPIGVPRPVTIAAVQGRKIIPLMTYKLKKS